MDFHPCLYMYTGLSSLAFLTVCTTLDDDVVKELKKSLKYNERLERKESIVYRVEEIFQLVTEPSTYFA